MNLNMPFKQVKICGRHDFVKLKLALADPGGRGPMIFLCLKRYFF